MDVLVIDIGGSNVKLAVHDQPTRKFKSGPDLTPDKLVTQVQAMTSDWKIECISIGYPGLIHGQHPVAEPGNLGPGWVNFDFEKAFGLPTRFVNDAAMQALGGYESGRMLFLGLGTGLGSALVINRVVVPLELGGLLHPSGKMLWKRLGKKGLEKYGLAKWLEDVHFTTNMLREAFSAEHVLIGGGNAKLVKPLPPHCRRGGNHDAVTGGFRLWEHTVEPHDREPSMAWRVV